jgi:hypothetical protein
LGCLVATAAAAAAAAASCLQQELATQAAAVAGSLLCYVAGTGPFDLAMDFLSSKACMAGTGQQHSVAAG